MRNVVNSYVEKFKHAKQARRRVLSVIVALALVVSCGVYWELREDGVAMANETFCGQEEHLHGDECYEEVLVCGQEEGEDHTHDTSCYESVLTCETPEHTHTVACLIDETADVEAAADWEVTLPEELSGIWADDVVAVAQSQIGYAESEANFRLAEDEETRHGYTRYGEWYGNAYGDWDAMFASFCLYYAGVPEDEFPEAAGVYAWTTELNEMEEADETGETVLLVDAAGYIPEPGDLVFFDMDDEDNIVYENGIVDIVPDHVGIVEAVQTDEEILEEVWVIEGDREDAVQRVVYDYMSDEPEDIEAVLTIEAYGILPKQADDDKNEEGEEVAEINGVIDESDLVDDIAGDEQVEEVDSEIDTYAAKEAGTGYKTYTAEDGGVSVTVCVPDGALPEGTELSVTLFDKDSEEYAEAASAIGIDKSIQALTAADDGGFGMVAMDISFLVDNEETEPTDTVSVIINAEDVLPKDVNALAAWHLEADDDGLESEQVASGNGVESAMEFEVESFSTFSLTWHAGGWSPSASLSVTCYFDGAENSGLGPSDLSLGYENEFVFDNDNGLLVVDGYEIDHAEIRTSATESFTSFYSIKAVFDWNGTWTYYYKTSSGGTDLTISSADDVSIRLYYVTSSTDTEDTGDLHISGDSITTSGSLTATYDKASELENFDTEYYFRWYRLKDGIDEDDADIDDYSEWTEMIGWVGDTLPIYSEAARHTYHVELCRVSNDEVVARSNPYLVPYYNDVQNGSFENVSNGSTLTMQYTDNLYIDMVWRTTGYGSLGGETLAGEDIEIVRPSADMTSAISSYGYGKTAINAAAGEQFAELNCEYDGTLYQDVLTTPDEVMTWSLDHMARNSSDFSPRITSGSAVDTMCVIVMDATTADYEFTGPYATSQEALIQALVSASGLSTPSANSMTDSSTFNYTFSDGSTSSVTMWLISSDDASWHEYSGTYAVPSGQYLSRFLFGAVSTASGSRTKGNMLDDIHLTGVSMDADGLLTITKEVDGVAASQIIPAGTFTFDIYETNNVENAEPIESVLLPTRDASITDEEAWEVAINVSTLGHDDIKIVETVPVDIGSYQYTNSTSWTVNHTSSGDVDENVTATNGNGEGLTTNAILVANNVNTAVTFTNTYQEYITIEKVVSGSLSTMINGAEFKMKDSNGNTLSFVETTNEVPDGDGNVTGTQTVYTVASEGDLEDQSNKIVDSFTIGSAIFVGLGDNEEYTLTEVTAPSGYDGLTDSIVFKIENGQILVKSGEDFVTQSGAAGEAYNDTLTLLITNSKLLPSAGGPGTRTLTLFGLLLAGTAAGLLYRNRKRGVMRS